ncbi:MAG: hypothetical protein KBA26_09995, partial [Candidatus Delongbacteria bacterium]|nr:hypothetical protein [Candidatus Delongbacteria bacterium]
IVIRPGIPARIREKMADSSISAVVGVYSGDESDQGLVTRYKNHWIRFSYCLYQGPIDWIFGSITAMRKETFDRTHGFNTSLAARDGIDDIEFGKRLVENGFRIELDTGLIVTHLKEFTLFSLLRNEFYRSMGFARLAMLLGQTGQSIGHGFANIYPEFIIGTLYGPAMGLAGIASLIWKIPHPGWLLGLVGVYLVLNIRFLLYLFRERQYRLCLISPGLLWLDQVFCLIGGGWGTLIGLCRRFFTRNTPS